VIEQFVAGTDRTKISLDNEKEEIKIGNKVRRINIIPSREL